MRRFAHIGICLGVVVLLNVAAYCFVMRADLTDDHRYSLSAPTKEMLHQLDAPIEARLYLDGALNPGFQRLRTAVEDMLEEMSVCSKQLSLIKDAPTEVDYQQLEKLGVHPILIHEREKDGRTAQTNVWPYLTLNYKGKQTVVSLLRNNRGLSGEENLNQSIENLEYAIAEALHSLTRTETRRIAFLEGHGELPEPNVYDLSLALSRYFQIDRGVLGNDADVLNNYAAVIIADPQEPFSESDKYILDHYVQQGGNLLWVVNGVRFSQDILSSDGYTPVIGLDLHLTDLFFRWGVRINPALVQDRQCLPIPVDVSDDAENPNWQPMPWYYAPLLLTSEQNAITRGVMQVSSTFASPIDVVGGEDGLSKEILLATSSASRLIATPAEVDLGDMNPNPATFAHQYVPIAVSVEGEQTSLFAHRMRPEGIEVNTSTQATKQRSRQVFVGSGSVIRNEIQQGQALPLGYDRYSRMQFGNRDFLVNAVLWLTDEEGLINLRSKEVALRLINDERAHSQRQIIEIISTLLPIVILACFGLLFTLIRKRKYTQR